MLWIFKGKMQRVPSDSVRKLEPAVLEGLKEIMEGVRPLQFKIIKSEEPTAQSTHEILTERLHDIEKKKNVSGRLTGMALIP